MRSPDRIAGIGLLIIAAYTIYQSTMVLPLFWFGQPGSGLMPFLLGLALAALAVPLVLSKEAPAAPETTDSEARGSFVQAGGGLRLLLALGLFALAAATFELLGAPVTAGVLVALWLMLIERKPARVALLAAVLTGIGVWLIFGVALKAELPQGIWMQ